MFQLSPGVNVSEIDQSTGVPAISTSAAAIAGVFRWGPVGQRVRVSSEPELAIRFAKPTSFNAETWFSAASFLAYSTDLVVSRAAGASSSLAVFSGAVAPAANTQTINNVEVYNAKTVTFSANVAYVAKYPGELGNSLRISVCDSANAYSKTLQLVANSDIASSSNLAISVGSTTGTVSVGFAGAGTQATANAQAYVIKNALQVGDNIRVGNSSLGVQFLKVSNVGIVTGNSTIATFALTFAEPYRLYADWAANSLNRTWEFHSLVEAAPGQSEYVGASGNTAASDEVHAVIVDEGGKFTGNPGTVLEVYKGMSRASDAKTEDGGTNFYRDVINTRSNYVWWATDRTGAVANTAANILTASTDAPMNLRFAGGEDGPDEGSTPLARLAQAADLFKNADDQNNDIAFVIAGKARTTDGVALVNYLIDNISESRKDCITFASPPRDAVVNNTGNEVESILTFANQLRATSYGFVDSGYKYMYDKYNDIYRWVPLNGDIAGLCARTDQTNDPWWSPAGPNRGQIKNVVKLAFNPGKAARDALYKVSVNPVILQQGEGPILFGDKTLLKKSSAFDRINVRRLFIVLERSIAQDSRRMLFEFNDEFTRSQFRNRVVPFLRDVMGRRGIVDFQVVCDESNNTPEVIDRSEFIGDIYIKPNRSINAIQLNFVAVRSGVQFNEIVGQF